MTPQIVKLGGSLLRAPPDYGAAARWIADRLTDGPHWIVVSAAYGVTDRLVRLADAASAPEAEALWSHHEALAGSALPSSLWDDLSSAVASARAGRPAPLVTWGERASCAALQARLAREGVLVPIVEYSARFVPHRTSLLVTGFYVRDRRGRPRPIARGGSDVVAALLAARSGSRELRLWKAGGGVWAGDGTWLPEIGANALAERIGDTTRPVHVAAVRIAARRGFDLILEDPARTAPSTRVRPEPVPA